MTPKQQNTMKTVREHCDKLQTALAELIRPELEQHERGGPFIVLGSETGLQCCGEFYGLTSPKMAIWLQAEIPAWRNGPCWLSNDLQILSDCGGDVESVCLTLTANAVHELSHCLMIPRLCGDSDSADERGRQLFPLITNDMATNQPYLIAIDREQHGPEFIRTMLHVRWRLIQRGWFVPFHDLMDWGRYVGHSAEQARMALKDEFKRLECLPLSAIQSTPAPMEFVKLFEGPTVLVGS